ncbi:MAG TPA: hypothetical protein VMY42_24750 [Thermoguttaceae bacterium]|nr:hypothetical protein [Thermoguttaceae bacterium]
MVTNAADGALESCTPVIMPGDTPTIVDSLEEASETCECRYCGHYPCGCGG